MSVSVSVRVRVRVRVCVCVCVWTPFEGLKKGVCVGGRGSAVHCTLVHWHTVQYSQVYQNIKHDQFSVFRCFQGIRIQLTSGIAVVS